MENVLLSAVPVNARAAGAHCHRTADANRCSYHRHSYYFCEYCNRDYVYEPSSATAAASSTFSW